VPSIIAVSDVSLIVMSAGFAGVIVSLPGPFPCCKSLINSDDGTDTLLLPGEIRVKNIAITTARTTSQIIKLRDIFGIPPTYLTINYITNGKKLKRENSQGSPIFVVVKVQDSSCRGLSRNVGTIFSSPPRLGEPEGVENLDCLWKAPYAILAVRDAKMSLDLNQVATQIEGMAANLKAEQKDKEGRLSHALEVFHAKSSDLDSLRKRVESSKTTWLVAGIASELIGRHKAVSCPPDLAVIAVDGSHIDVDRHSAARCCLINIGSVVLRYGQKPEAMLRSQPALYASEQDLTIADPLGRGEQPWRGGCWG